MYEDFYALRELPFELTANTKYLYLAPSHREALSNLRYGIAGHRGITLLVGEAGTGKTTLVRSILDTEGGRTLCVYLNNPSLTRFEFIEFLARAFGLGDRAATSKTILLAELERVLLERYARDMRTALLIDEAQALPLELLEEIRLLSNIETPQSKPLSIVLAGQPQVADKLNLPDLGQLKQRVALRCTLRPFELNETAAYIAERIRIAGGHGRALFTRPAIELIHRCSRGIPRTISVICDNALMNGFAVDQRPVGWKLVHDVCSDFDLNPPLLASVPDHNLGIDEPQASRGPFGTSKREPHQPRAEGMPLAASSHLGWFARHRPRFSLFGADMPSNAARGLDC
jgi:general secretion pathway protein A